MANLAVMLADSDMASTTVVRLIAWVAITALKQWCVAFAPQERGKEIGFFTKFADAVRFPMLKGLDRPD
jgi:hypothetical protein